MKNLNLSSVTDTSGLPAGGYILKIKSVEDVESKEYLKLQLDIAEGPYADYYANLDDRYGFWGLIWYMSYKSKALGLFKSGIKAIKASNASFVWDDDAANDEQQMVGCLIGGLLREEEYQSNDGKVKSNVKFYKALPVDVIRTGSFTVPERKRLESRNATNDVVDTTAAFVPIKDEDMPF